MTQPEREPEFTQDPSMLGGNIADPDEFLRLGMVHLGESISKVSEHGADAVTEYVGALLEDNEKTAPTDERAALFNVLAAGQKAEIRSSLVANGSETVRSMLGTDERLKKTLEETINPMRVADGRLGEFAAGIGRTVGNGNLRGADAAQQAAAQDAKRHGASLAAIGVGMTTWRQQQGQRLTGLNNALESGKSHEKALDEAAKTLLPDYEGEPQDIVGLINSSVVTRVSGDLANLVQAAGESDQSMEEAIGSYVQSANDEQTVGKVRTLLKFVQDYRGVLNSSNKTLTAANETDQRLKRLARSTEEAYSRMNPRQTDMAGKARVQSQLARESVDGGRATIRFAQLTLQDSGQAIERVK